MDRQDFFTKLEKLVKSSRSNYEHGRSYVGQGKMIEAHDLITEFLGDNLDDRV